jgi:formylglycine-generating enzyme required for sulfatase activity
MYADGKTPEGVWDLAGNMWEWLQEPKGRLKGGAWLWDAEQAEASSHDGGAPRSWNYYYGFRVVVVPIR